MGKASSVPPIWLMRQAGRHLPEYRAVRKTVSGFLELCYTPDLAAEVTLQPIRRFGYNAAILFSDILVIPDALGQSVRFVPGEGPKLEPLADRAAIQALDTSRVLDHLAPVFETVRKVRAGFEGDTTLIGFAGAPWTVATYMIEGGSSRDFARAKRWAYADPDGFQELMDMLVVATSAYLIGQIDAGAEVIQLFDSWAGALPASLLEMCCFTPIAQIVASVRAHRDDIPIIGFPRGIGIHGPDFVRETKVDAISIDSGVDPVWAQQNLQPLALVQGNLDPIALLTGGAALDREIDSIVSALVGRPFIFNLGHGILPETPIDHVSQLIDRVRATEVS